MILTIAVRNLLHRPLRSITSWLLLTCASGMLALLLLVQAQAGRQFEQNVAGIDMVLGAKGSPLQLILSSVYHIDAPTGNIPLREAQPWMQHPMVRAAIPLSLGDSYQGFRIVGTTPDYIRHYGGQMAQGRMFRHSMEAVLGSAVAARYHLGIGDRFNGMHGLGAEGHVHEGHPYTVSGILAPAGNVLDQVILTSLNSVWDIHDHHHQEEEEHHTEAGEPASDSARQVTAVLLQFRNPMAQLQLPRWINTHTRLQAAVPAIEVNRLLSLMGSGIQLLRLIGWLLMALAACSIFFMLLQSLQERRYELALLRSLGAGRARLLALVLTEAALLGVAGIAGGYLLSRGILAALQPGLAQQFHYVLQHWWQPGAGEAGIALLVLLVCLLAALLPGIRAFRLNISKTLSHA
ncbi:ABC transporter permease [Chitinophaga japonensis]